MNETHSSTQSPQQSDLSDVQGTFYQNIFEGGIWPTTIAIIIITIGLILEMGTFFGFLIPADLLLFMSGLILGANGRWGAGLVMFSCAVIAAIFGDLIGYYRSNKLGSTLYNKSDSWYFKKKHLYNAQAALEKYGDKIFYIGKFLHIRSFLPILAGISNMNIVKFGLLSMTSTLIWASATYIPSFFIGMIYPDLINSWWLLAIGTVIFISTEMIAWIILFNQDIKSIAHRISKSRGDFTAIKNNMIEIKHHIGDITEYVVKGDQKLDDDTLIKEPKPS